MVTSGGGCVLRSSHPHAAAGSELPLEYGFPDGTPRQRDPAAWQGQVAQGKPLRDGVECALAKRDLERAGPGAALVVPGKKQ